MRLSFTAPLWEYDEGPGSWHFVTLPETDADVVESTCEPRGFGSVRVRVTVGRTTWSTSLFPSPRHRSYLLPVKKSVRQAEDLVAGDPVRVTLEAVDPS